MVIYFEGDECGHFASSSSSLQVFPALTFFNEISDSTLHLRCSIGNSLDVKTNIK